MTGKVLAQKLFKEVVGMIPTRVELGHGSFITIDFGRDIPSQIKTRSGPKTVYSGEWHLWIYMCAWRLDKENIPLTGSNDSREKIREILSELASKTLEEVSILNDAFDAIFRFSGGLELRLFSYNTDEHQQWMFFTPGEKVFTAGPSSKWSYPSSDE